MKNKQNKSENNIEIKVEKSTFVVGGDWGLFVALWLGGKIAGSNPVCRSNEKNP